MGNALVRKGGGKQKGAGWERQLSVMLSRWVSAGNQDDVYWRSALSGGRATIGFRKGQSHGSQVGDLSCIHPIGQKFIDAFAIEAKFYADLDYKGLLTGKGKLLDFWAEITEQAGRYQKLPFLAARQNRMPTFICLGKSGMRKLDLRDKDTTLISFPHDIYLIEAAHFVKICKPYI